VHLRLQTDTIPQIDYDDYDDLGAQVLWTIEVHLPYEWSSTAIALMTKAAIDKSSANNLWTLSQQKTKVGGAGTNGDSGWNIQIQDRNGEMQRVRAHIDCGATRISWHRGFSSDSGYHIRRHSSPPSPWPEVWCNVRRTAGRRGSQSSAWTISHR